MWSRTTVTDLVGQVGADQAKSLLSGALRSVVSLKSVGYVLLRTFSARGWNRASDSDERSPANGNSGLAFVRRIRP